MMPITLPVTVRLAKPINTARHTKMLHIMPLANSVRSWPKESTKQYGSSQKKGIRKITALSKLEPKGRKTPFPQNEINFILGEWLISI